MEMRERNECTRKSTSDQERETKMASESSNFGAKFELYRGYVINPYLLLVLMDVLTEKVTENAPESIIFADETVLCGRKEVAMT